MTEERFFFDGWDSFNDGIKLKGGEHPDFVEGWKASEHYHLKDIKKQDAGETSKIEVPNDGEIETWFAGL